MERCFAKSRKFANIQGSAPGAAGHPPADPARPSLHLTSKVVVPLTSSVVLGACRNEGCLCPSCQFTIRPHVIERQGKTFMSEHDMTHRVKSTACVRTSVHEGGAVFLHLQDARLFAAGSVGADIWKGLERQLDSEAIAAKLHERYGVPYETTRADVIRFIHELERAGLVERRLP